MEDDFAGNNAENEPPENMDMEHVFIDGIVGALMWIVIILVLYHFLAPMISKMF